jgi:hypothetical protein
MRPLGSILMATGVLVGVLVGFALLTGITMPGVPWLVAVGLVKLTLFASVGLLAAGATLHRLARRSEERAKIGSGD